jgi:hypothetical protein
MAQGRRTVSLSSGNGDKYIVANLARCDRVEAGRVTGSKLEPVETSTVQQIQFQVNLVWFFGHIVPCQVLPEAVTVQSETIIKEVVFSKGHKLANVDYEELLLLAAHSD